MHIHAILELVSSIISERGSMSPSTLPCACASVTGDVSLWTIGHVSNRGAAMNKGAVVGSKPYSVEKGTPCLGVIGAEESELRFAENNSSH